MKKNKKIGIIFICILAVLVLLLIGTSMGGKAAYDREKPPSTEGEDIMADVETNIVETEVKEPEVTETKSQEPEPSETLDPDVPTTDPPRETVSGNEPEEIIPPDRTIYAEGFFYEPLSEDIKEKITGVSFHENDNITYDDLRYLNVLYVDFNGDTQTGEIICNKAIAQDLMEIFKELYDNEYQIDKIRLIDEYGGDDDLSCDDNKSSCFNYRVVGGTDSLSKHALGLAIDINPFQNPYITYPNGVERISPAGSEPYADRDSGLPHMILEGDLCYNLFTSHGFTWGGHWKSLKDYQHFQKTL